MTPTEARATLRKAGLTQSELGRLLSALGDRRDPEAVARGVRRAFAQTHDLIPAHMAALVRVLCLIRERCPEIFAEIDADIA